MRYSWLIVGLLVMMTACQGGVQTPTETYRCPDGRIVTDLADCAAAAPTQEKAEQDTIEKPVMPDDVEPAPDETTRAGDDGRSATDIAFGSDERPTEAVAPELEELRARAQTKTANGYSYRLESIVKNGIYKSSIFAGVQIWVKDKMRAIRFEKKTRLPGGEEASYVVLDLDTSTGTRYCTLSRCEQKDEEVTIDVDIMDHIEPLEWLYTLEDTQFEGKQSVSGRNAMKITGTKDGEGVLMMVDEYSGLPLQVTFGDTTYTYEIVSFSVSDEVFDGP